MNPSRPADAVCIRQQMREIRSELQREAHELAEESRELLDWRRYVTEHPWASIAAAVAIGYLVVPNRLNVIRPDVETLLGLARQGGLVIQGRGEIESAKGRGGLGGLAASLLSSALLRALAAYAGRQAGRTFEEHVSRATAESDQPQRATPP